MEKYQIEKALDGILDALAAVEHGRWAHWQRYLHSKAERQADGSLLIPADLVKRWEKQIATSYAGLTEAEKESDREQVRKYLALIVERLSES